MKEILVVVELCGCEERSSFLLRRKDTRGRVACTQEESPAPHHPLFTTVSPEIPQKEPRSGLLLSPFTRCDTASTRLLRDHHSFVHLLPFARSKSHAGMHVVHFTFRRSTGHHIPRSARTLIHEPRTRPDCNQWATALSLFPLPAVCITGGVSTLDQALFLRL